MKKRPALLLPQSDLLLTDLLSQVVCMRLDRLAPLVRELHSFTASHPRLAAFHALPQCLEDDEERWPWEEPLYSVEDGVAILRIHGPMVKGYDDVTCWFWGLASIDRLQLTMQELASRADVRAVLLSVDSGGGSAMGTPELGDAVAALDAIKPTFSFTSGMMCSAAYWTACAASAVFATRSAMVGSIGTYMAVTDYSALFEEMGIKVEVFKRGAFKGMFIPGTTLTDEQRQWIDAQIGRMNGAFTSFVVSQRGPIAESTMQGQWFDGPQALELGLIDATVSGLPEVLSAIRAQVGPLMSRPAI